MTRVRRLGVTMMVAVTVVFAACTGSAALTPNSTTTTSRKATLSASATVVASPLSMGDSISTSNLQAVDFLSRTTGVALTDSAFAHRRAPMRLATSDDEGEHWRTVGVALPKSFWGASSVTLGFASTKVGFVDSGVALLSTVDGGLQWRPVRLGAEVTEISLVGSSAWAVVIGCPGTATTTPHCPAYVDSSRVGPHGAAAWQVHPLPIMAIPGVEPTLARPSATIGVMTGLLWPDDKKNPLLVTEDGGRVWRVDGSPCASGDWTGPGAVAAVSSKMNKSSDWWLLCNGGGPGMGTDFKAIDWSGNEGAGRWAQLAAFTSVSPYRDQGDLPTGDAGPLVATSRLRLWLLTSNSLSTSSDGGRQWTTLRGIALDGGGEVASFSFIDSSHGWLATPGVGLWRTVNGRSWTKLDG